MDRANIEFILLIFIIIIFGIFIYKKYFQIPVKPEIPVSIIKECKPQKILVTAEENNKKVNITVEVKEKTNGLCLVKYVSRPGGLEILNEFSYYYNDKGNLCVFETFRNSIAIGKFICNFISLDSIS